MAKVTELLEKLKKRETDAKEFRATLKSVKELEEDIDLEIKVLDEDEDEDKDKIKVFKESVSISCKLLEKSVDAKKRTVIAGVLQENTLSSNNRFYPASIVQEAIKSLPGKRALIGHDTNNVEDVVAKITGSFMKDGIGFAEFKFGTDTKSDLIFNKIKEGLIDSTSIRATGETKRGKIDGEFVDVVESLSVASVDWVVEGGIEAAKVAQVFEQAPDINYNTKGKEKELKEKEDMEKVEVLQKQLDEQNKKLDDLIKVNETLKTDKESSDSELSKQKLETYKESKLSAIPDEEIRALVKEQLTATDEKALDEQFGRQVKYHEAIRVKAGLKNNEVHIVPTDKTNDDDKTLEFKDVNGFMESKQISKKVKCEALSTLMG